MKAYIGMFFCFLAIYIIEGLYALSVSIIGVAITLAAYFIIIKFVKK